MPGHIHLSLSQVLLRIHSWHPAGTYLPLSLDSLSLSLPLSFLLSIFLLFNTHSPHLCSSSALSSISQASQPPILHCQIREQKGPADRNPKLIYKQWCRSRADRTVFVQYEGTGSDASEAPLGRGWDRAIFVIIGRDLDPPLSFCLPRFLFSWINVAEGTQETNPSLVLWKWAMKKSAWLFLKVSFILWHILSMNWSNIASCILKGVALRRQLGLLSLPLLLLFHHLLQRFSTALWNNGLTAVQNLKKHKWIKEISFPVYIPSISCCQRSWLDQSSCDGSHDILASPSKRVNSTV